MMLAAVASGHADAADIFLLISFILAAVATVITALRSPEGALLPAAVAFLALGLLVV